MAASWKQVRARLFTGPAGADELESGDGSTRVLSGPTIDVPVKAGVYFLRRGGSRVGAIVANPEPRESNLARLTPGALEARLHGRHVRVVTSADRWAGAVFDAQADRPLSGLFLLLALALLLVETLLTRGVRRVHALEAAPARRAA